MTAARLPLVALLLASGGCAARADEATPSPPFDASQMSNRTEPSTYEEVQALVEQLSKDLASEGLVQSASGTCPTGYTCASSGKFTIIARGGGFDWNHGMALCTSAGMRPAKIADASEFTQALDLRTSMTGVRHVWLGANDRATEGQWRNYDNTPLAYTPWASYEPNNWRGEDCAHFPWSTPPGWNDIACYNRGTNNGVLCEVPASPPPPPPSPPPPSIIDAVNNATGAVGDAVDSVGNVADTVGGAAGTVRDASPAEVDRLADSVPGSATVTVGSAASLHAGRAALLALAAGAANLR